MESKRERKTEGEMKEERKERKWREGEKVKNKREKHDRLYNISDL